MAETNTPVAPSSVPAEPSVANQTNPTNPVPASTEASAESTITAEQVAKFFGTTPEIINKSKTFYDNSGGYEKGFMAIKQERTDPEKSKAANQSQEPTQQPQQPAQPTQPAELTKTAPKVPDGMITPQELAIQQYYYGLAEKKEYASIADEIRSGEVFKTMKNMGMQPIVDGNVNAAQVNQFLDMYAKTKPAVTPSTPIDSGSSAPTNNFTQVPDGKFTSIAQAQDIASQPNHPQHNLALDYIYTQMSGKKSTGQNTQA